jgi:RecJ-like exonuclease
VDGLRRRLPWVLPASLRGYTDRMEAGDSEHVVPGDEARAEAEGIGEDLCPKCAGSGRTGDEACSACKGTGKVTSDIGGG